VSEHKHQNQHTFLFGRPVRAARTGAIGPRKLFVLGAYPSALHVRWTPPDRSLSVRALAVDNEPEPFWTGDDQEQRIEQWRRDVSFKHAWGSVEPCGRLNGSSGKWLEERVLRPVGFSRADAWITDCLDTYFESEGAAARLDATAMRSLLAHLHIPNRCLPKHPSEREIVSHTLAHHSSRLREELLAAQPETVVTLGNAALSVFRELLEETKRPEVERLAHDRSQYGRIHQARLFGRAVTWIPLAHPGAPDVYQRAHRLWQDRIAFELKD